MNIYSHRGLCYNYPENSRSALLAAIREGFDLEIDLRITKDKKIVLLHDTNFKRLCNDTRVVSLLTSKEIRGLSFMKKPDEAPFFLEDLLSEPVFQNSSIRLSMHFKQEDQSVENCTVIAEIFAKWNLFEQAFLFNVSIKTAEQIKRLDERIALAYVVSDQRFEPAVYLWEEAKDRGRSFDIVWAAEHHTLYTSDFVKEIRKNEKELIMVSPELHKNLGHPLAVKGYKSYWPLFAKWKIDGVCTDFPREYRRKTG